MNIKSLSKLIVLLVLMGALHAKPSKPEHDETSTTTMLTETLHKDKHGAKDNITKSSADTETASHSSVKENAKFNKTEEHHSDTSINHQEQEQLTNKTTGLSADSKSNDVPTNHSVIVDASHGQLEHLSNNSKHSNVTKIVSLPVIKSTNDINVENDANQDQTYEHANNTTHDSGEANSTVIPLKLASANDDVKHLEKTDINVDKHENESTYINSSLTQVKYEDYEANEKNKQPNNASSHKNNQKETNSNVPESNQKLIEPVKNNPSTVSDSNNQDSISDIKKNTRFTIIVTSSVVISVFLMVSCLVYKFLIRKNPSKRYSKLGEQHSTDMKILVNKPEAVANEKF